MKCVICKQGEAKPGQTLITLDRDGTIIVFKSVPAQVCQNCGEEYVDDAITEKLLKQAEEAAQSGIQVDVRNYAA